MPQRRYGEGPGGLGAPPAVPGYTWVMDESTLPRSQGLGGLAVWQLNPSPAPAGQTPGQSPIGATGTTPFPTIPNFGLPDIAQITAAINQMELQGFQQAEGNRIPGQAGLEGQSSADIQSLLSPAEYFPGTSRESAEIAGLRGLPGEAGASDSTWVRRTREEQLREMGLGQQFLTAALARHPIGPQYDPSGLAAYLAQLPEHQAQLLTQQQQFAAQQQQQRELALAQMENAYRIAQLTALRGGRALTGGYGGHPGYAGFQSGAGAATPYNAPVPPIPVGQGFGVAETQPAFPNVNAAFPEIPLNQGWDLPTDFGLDLNQILEPDSLYA